jgi:thioredoxin 1
MTEGTDMASIEITKDNFQAEVLDSPEPVLLDLWAAWCGPCRMLSPIVDEIAQDYAGRLKVGKIDVDAEPELASAFQVQSIPMIVLVKGGEVVAGAIGARPKDALVDALELETHAAAA